MPQVDLNSIPPYARLTVARAMDLEGIKRQEIYNRMNAPADPHAIAWALASNQGPGPKQIRLIDARTLTQGTPEVPGGRDRWLKALARERMESSEFFNLKIESSPAHSPASNVRGTQDGQRLPEAATLRGDYPGASGPSTQGEHQGDLFLSPVSERLQGEYEEKRIAEQRFQLIEPILNGRYRATHLCKGDYIKELVSELERKGRKISASTLYRWASDWKKAGGGVLGLKALMDNRPGPKPSGIEGLQLWMMHQIQSDRVDGHFTREQCYARLLQEIARRQQAFGPEKIYPVPTRWGVFRFFASLGPLVEVSIEGRSALKAAQMQVHRTYTDCHSLDRVDNDEWIFDAFSYDPMNLLWRSGARKGQPRTGRFYLLTMLDERSIYPLDASLVEFPDQEDEIDLLVSVCLEYGVPGLINSDRGRFRGKAFGGAFRQFDREKTRERQNGILDRLNIGRNAPREHNPQGNRLERFHLELARFARTLPGWCGASTDEKDELSNAEADLKAHAEYCHGRSKTTPLLSRDELLARTKEFFCAWCDEHQSEGTDMNGLTPSVVFRREAPPEGHRPITAPELDRLTARVYRNVLVEAGGHIDIPEGNYQSTRYYSHELLLIQGERRTAERSRWDRSKIWVLPSREGEEEIVAPLMPRVGVANPEHLGQAIAEKTFSRHLIQAAVSRVEICGTEFTGEKMGLKKNPEVIPSSRERISADELFDVPRTKTSQDMAREAWRLEQEQE